MMSHSAPSNEPVNNQQATQDYLDELRMLDEGCGCWMTEVMPPPAASDLAAAENTDSPQCDSRLRQIAAVLLLTEVSAVLRLIEIGAVVSAIASWVIAG